MNSALKNRQWRKLLTFIFSQLPLADTAPKRPPTVGQLVPAFPHSLWLTFYNTDISLRRGHMDSAGPEGVRLRERVHHYILQSYLLLFWTGKFMNQHAFPVLDIAQ